MWRLKKLYLIITVLSGKVINLKKLRLQKGLSQRKLADKANISQSMLSDIENNKVNPTIITLQKLAKALDIDIAELIQASYYILFYILTKLF